MKAAVILTLAVALAAAAPVPASAADAPQAPNRFATAIAPGERFEVKGMLVERHGSGARPLILVPGLASGAWVWQETVREFAASHTVYVVTLPGFDGRPAVAGDPFDTSRAALAELIVSRKLAAPVLIGHSLGATLAIALAQELPDRIGGAILIDGLPVFPRTEDTPPEQRAPMAESMRQRVAALAPQAFSAQQQQYMRSSGMVDMGRADDAARLTARSDPAAVASYMSAVLARDLRPGLPGVRAQVLVLAPYYAPDAVYLGGMTSNDKVAYYRHLMSGTPRLQVEAIDNARHFAMIDQPGAVADAIRRFLKQL